MMLRTAILAFLACLTAACGGQPDDRKDDRSDKGNPLLWEIARADGPNAGQVEGWLMGTIHALPSEAKWRSKEADEAIAKADVLAVEVADVGDGRAMASAFLPLAMSAGQPPLTERVPPRQREKVAELVGKTSYRLSDFSRIESWGAALILSQAVKTGAKSENGIDRALIADFAKRRVVELEGAPAQFAAFDGLSERAQRAMLAAIVEDSGESPEKLREPIDLYLAGDAEGLERLTHEGMLRNPEIRTTLLTRRNADWTAKIDRMLAAEPLPLIAVGAAHMVGEDGLVAQLEAKGYRVTRIGGPAAR